MAFSEFSKLKVVLKPYFTLWKCFKNISYVFLFRCLGYSLALVLYYIRMQGVYRDDSTDLWQFKHLLILLRDTLTYVRLVKM